MVTGPYRSLKDPGELMKQLLIYQGLGDWRHINRWTQRLHEVDADELLEVAAATLRPEARTIAIYRRQGEARP